MASGVLILPGPPRSGQEPPLMDFSGSIYSLSPNPIGLGLLLGC